MAIRTDYTITDEVGVEEPLADVSVTKTFDGDQAAEVITLNQNGSEIVLTLKMAEELTLVIGKLQK